VQISIVEGEILALKQNEESSKYLFTEAQNLYERWNTFTKEEKRDIIESITDSIVVDKEDITINLKYLVPTSFINKSNGPRNSMGSLRPQA